MTISPSLTGWPATSVSRSAIRAVSCTGDSSRRISSTAFGHSSGRSAERAQMLGVVEQHANPVAQQVHRGLESGRQHQAGDRPKLVAIEIRFRRTTFGLADQLAHQIVAGSRGAACPDGASSQR